jgi:hypothetical protein
MGKKFLKARELHEAGFALCQIAREPTPLSYVGEPCSGGAVTKLREFRPVDP